MALSAKAKQDLVVAMASVSLANEMSTALDAAANTPAAHIAALGVISPLVGVDGTASNAAPLTTTQTRLANIEAKIDALLAAMVAAHLMS